MTEDEFAGSSSHEINKSLTSYDISVTSSPHTSNEWNRKDAIVLLKPSVLLITGRLGTIKRPFEFYKTKNYCNF